jgi:hypothetical protein
MSRNVPPEPETPGSPLPPQDGESPDESGPGSPPPAAVVTETDVVDRGEDDLDDLEAAVGAKPRHDRIRMTAIIGTFASLLLLASYFLPWIEIVPAQRAAIRDAVRPDVDALQAEDRDLAREYRALLDTGTDQGSLGALDLFRWSRLAPRLNSILEKDPARGEPDVRSRPHQVRRAFFAGAVVLAALPILAFVLAAHFVTHRMRRARSPILIVLVLAGACGTALALAWDVVASQLYEYVSTGIGVHLALVASVAQACSGLFGVTGRNWWRVYAGSAVTLAALLVLVYVWITTGQPA